MAYQSAQPLPISVCFRCARVTTRCICLSPRCPLCTRKGHTERECPDRPGHAIHPLELQVA